jgi:hypothetical protein
MSAFAAGGIVGGRYILQKSLRSGQAGEVWGAFDTQLKVHCVVKAAAPDAFEREFRFLSAHRSLHFPRCGDPIEIEGRPALVLEFRRGRSLAQLFADALAGPAERDGAFLLEAIARVATLIAAVHAAGHSYGAIAGEDILVDENGLSLLDFGDVAPLPTSPDAARAATRADVREIGALVQRLGAVGPRPLQPHAVVEASVRALRDGRLPDVGDLLERVREVADVLALLEAAWACGECASAGARGWRCATCGAARAEPRLDLWRTRALEDARLAAAAGRWSEVLSSIHALEDAALPPDGTILRATALARTGRPREALATLDALGPRALSEDAAVVRCEALLQCGAKDEALAFVRALGDITERSEEVVVAVAGVLVACRRPTDAEDLLSRYLARVETAGRAAYGLAVLAPRGSPERLRRLERSIAAERTPPDAYIDLAREVTARGDSNRAFRALAAGRERHPTSARIALELAALARQTGSREPEAADALARAIDAHPEELELPRELCRLLAHAERWSLLRDEVRKRPAAGEDPVVIPLVARAEIETGAPAAALARLEGLWAARPGGRAALACLHAIRAALLTHQPVAARVWRDRLDRTDDVDPDVRALADRLLAHPQ